MKDALTQARIDLASALRWAHRYGLSEGVCNHFSLAAPGLDDRFLINPQGVHWAEAWAEVAELSELLAIPVCTSLQGKSAFPETHPLALGSGGLATTGPVDHFLRAARASIDVAKDGPPIVLTTLPGELHGLGIQMAAILAGRVGWRPHLLGVNTPLDEIVRDHLNEQLLQLWAKTNKTVVFVTHSIPEAVFLSTKIVVMTPRPGKIHDVINSDLPRERTLDIRETPEFLKIAHRVRAGLRAGHSYED